MFEKLSVTKITYFVFLAVASLSFLTGLLEYQDNHSLYQVKLDKKLLTESKSGVVIKLDHEYKEAIPNDLSIEIHDIDGKTYRETIQNIGNQSLLHKLNLKSSQLKNVFIESKASLKIKEKGRLLTQSDSSPPAFDMLFKIISGVCSFSRNIILVALVTNTFDVWMPFLMFIETFMCLGYWTHNSLTFTIIFKEMHSSKVSIFNFIRSILFNTFGFETSSNIYLANYGLSNRFVLNCSGELVVLALVLLIFIVIKVSTMFCKSERMRLMSSKIRPLFNGYMFWMCPRILSMAGFSLRIIPEKIELLDIVHFIISGLTIVIFILFFIILTVQIKRVNTKLEYLEENRHQIGLVSRIDYMKDFEFDCLEYSMLYYPSMNVLRTIIAHLCIGLAPDFHYVQFGGPIVSEIFFLMIQVSSSGYILTRHRVIYPLLNFLQIMFLLCFIGVGLIYGVGHLELTIKLESVCFAFWFFIVGVLVIQTGFDVFLHCKTEDKKQEEEYKSTKELSEGSAKNTLSTIKVEKISKKGSEKHRENTRADSISSEINSKEDLSYQVKSTKSTKQKSTKVLKVKKIKEGKMV